LSALWLLVALAGAPRQQAPAAPAAGRPTTVCIDCHLKTDIERLMQPVRAMTEEEDGKLVDVHARAGISCHDCHGGDPTSEEDAKDEAKGYLGKPKPQAIPELCGRCHSDIEVMKRFNPRLPTDQLRQYETSVHGKKLRAGDPKPATCSSCHRSHGVRAVKDPASPVFPTHVPQTCAACHADPAYMKEYSIPTDQLEKYRRSRHGQLVLESGDIGAPVCNTCHGNHGATPPGVADVHNVCGTCHAQQDEYFQKSTHAKAFLEIKAPGCVACHGNHEIPTPSDAMLSNAVGSVCLRCHQKGDRCYQAVDRISGLMASLQTRLAATERLLADAERLGMGVEKAKFSLNEVNDHFTKARIKVHQFQTAVVEEELKGGAEIVERAHRRGEEALEEWQFRRVGLGVSLGVILLTAAALVLKLRMMEGSERMARS
jgi:predicted CXXCH cytochrome family protein